MAYISVKQASELWGISSSRIGKLIRQGRIPGAKLIGKSWMIPSDVKKPSDERYKDVKAVKDDIAFRYPSYMDFEIYDYEPPLSNDELKIREAELLIHECRFEESEKVLIDIPNTSENIYIRIVALYLLCLIDIYTTKIKEFRQNYEKMALLMAEDFPYHEDMNFSFALINTFLGADKYFNEDFNISSYTQYHISTLPSLIAMSVYSMTIKAFNGNGPYDLSIYEINCNYLERKGYYSEVQMIHFYLSTLYMAKEDTKMAIYHAKRGMEIAESKKFYFVAALNYYYAGRFIDKILDSFPEEFSKKIKKYGNELYKKASVCSNALLSESSPILLTRKEYELLHLVIMNNTNKEIAKKLKISEVTVSKRLADIYSKYNVSNKYELRAKYENEKHLEGFTAKSK